MPIGVKGPLCGSDGINLTNLKIILNQPENREVILHKSGEPEIDET